jgi:hypothetical protein
LKKIFLFLSALLAASVLSAKAQSTYAEAAPASQPASEPRMFFPHNWARGFVDFEVAPSHNEPDLGRCAFPQPANAGGVNSACTAYARYFLGGYLELQPFGRTMARRLFLFFDPKFSFGNNLPQLKYTASMEPIALERLMGVGIELPKNFEFRVVGHAVDYLGRYAQDLGPADLHTFGPYGLYTTIGVRWKFGGYGHGNGAR